jgi:nucleoside-diphosphate-sugar epimerase
MDTVVITGAAGTVGSALAPRLADRFEVVSLDRDDLDLTVDAPRVADRFRGADVVIHLAFDPGGDRREDWRSPHRVPVNRMLFDTVLAAALQAGVAQFLHASSIHVEDTMAYSARPGPLLVARPGQFRTVPASGYGAAKREQEAALRAVADRFPRGAVSLRLGGVTRNDRPLAHHDDPAVLRHERRVWLSHRDLADLVIRIIDTSTGPGYDVVYAVSDNAGRFHDISNAYG